jgi:hypothetical protein
MRNPNLEHPSQVVSLSHDDKALHISQTTTKSGRILDEPATVNNMAPF